MCQSAHLIDGFSLLLFVFWLSCSVISPLSCNPDMSHSSTLLHSRSPPFSASANKYVSNYPAEKIKESILSVYCSQSFLIFLESPVTKEYFIPLSLCFLSSSSLNNNLNHFSFALWDHFRHISFHILFFFFGHTIYSLIFITMIRQT